MRRNLPFGKSYSPLRFIRMLLFTISCSFQFNILCLLIYTKSPSKHFSYPSSEFCDENHFHSIPANSYKRQEHKLLQIDAYQTYLTCFWHPMPMIELPPWYWTAPAFTSMMARRGCCIMTALLSVSVMYPVDKNLGTSNSESTPDKYWRRSFEAVPKQ